MTTYFVRDTVLTSALLHSWHEAEASRFESIAANYQSILDRADKADADEIARGGKVVSAASRASAESCKAEAEVISDFHRQAAGLLVAGQSSIIPFSYNKEQTSGKA